MKPKHHQKPTFPIITPAYASPQDVPKALRDIIRTLHHERSRPIDDIARIFDMPAQWVELFVSDPPGGVN